MLFSGRGVGLWGERWGWGEVEGDEKRGVFGAYGAALVSSKMCLSLRSWGSGRFWRCFSRELRRSMGEMGEVSTVSEEVSVFSVGVSVFSDIIAGVFRLVDGFVMWLLEGL